MRRTMLAILLALALVLIPVGSAFAATTADVTVNATPGFVSITNAPDFFDFGVVEGGSTPDTTTGWFTITNSSTVDMDINIQCDGWTDIAPIPEGVAWTYGAPAEDTAQLNASGTLYGAGGSTGPGDYDITVLDGVDTMLFDTVPDGENPAWELQLEAPTSFTHIDEQETTVTITASVS